MSGWWLSGCQYIHVVWMSGYIVNVWMYSGCLDVWKDCQTNPADLSQCQLDGNPIISKRNIAIIIFVITMIFHLKHFHHHHFVVIFFTIVIKMTIITIILIISTIIIIIHTWFCHVRKTYFFLRRKTDDQLAQKGGCNF